MNTLMQIFDEIFEFIKNLVPTGAEQYLLVIGAALGLTISVAVGGFDEMIYALIALMILDYITGIIAACRTGKWDSSTGFIGLAKKQLFWAWLRYVILLTLLWVRTHCARWPFAHMP